MQASREIEYRVSRRWQLHIWQITGQPQEWEQQLLMKLAAEPMFAVISGLGAHTWAPVQRFCQAAKLPCHLPNVELPVEAEGDFSPVYFSRGVLLEVDLMARALTDTLAFGNDRALLRRLVQIYRQGDVGESAATALASTASAAGISIDNRSLRMAATDRKDVEQAMRDLGSGDALVLWLRPDDLAAATSKAEASKLPHVRHSGGA